MLPNIESEWFSLPSEVRTRLVQRGLLVLEVSVHDAEFVRKYEDIQESGTALKKQEALIKLEEKALSLLEKGLIPQNNALKVTAETMIYLDEDALREAYTHYARALTTPPRQRINRGLDR